MSPVAVMIVVLAVALALLWRSARAATTICAIDVREGRIEVTHGGIAPRLLADLGDVVARPSVTAARVRIVRSRGMAEVELRGALSPAQAQQIRNVVGSVPLAKLMNHRGRR